MSGALKFWCRRLCASYMCVTSSAFFSRLALLSREKIKGETACSAALFDRATRVSRCWFCSDIGHMSRPPTSVLSPACRGAGQPCVHGDTGSCSADRGPYLPSNTRRKSGAASHLHPLDEHRDRLHSLRHPAVRFPGLGSTSMEAPQVRSHEIWTYSLQRQNLPTTVNNQVLACQYDLSQKLALFLIATAGEKNMLDSGTICPSAK